MGELFYSDLPGKVVIGWIFLSLALLDIALVWVIVVFHVPQNSLFVWSGKR